MRRWFCTALLMLFLLPMLALPVSARMEQSEYIQQILSQCLEEIPSRQKISDTIAKMEKAYPQEASVWRQIMDTWFYVNQEMTVTTDVLGDDLPQDDTLAIVVMGYQLNENGSMKPELLDRLGVAIRSAKKYPNAYILCTGGPTSKMEGITEAAMMRQWMTICGIDESRIILEENSFSTTENAQNSLMLLYDSHPQIHSLAIVTSDYHMRRSVMMFEAASLYASGYDQQEPITIVGNAASRTNGADEESLRTQIWGLAILAGVEMPNT